jgi:hypothetical protein
MEHMPVDNHGPCLRNMEAADSGVILTHEHNSETMLDTLQMNKVARAQLLLPGRGSTRHHRSHAARL